MIRIKNAVLEIDDKYEIKFLEDISVDELLLYIERYDDVDIGPHGFVARPAPLAPCLLIRSGHRICGRKRDDEIHRGKEPYT